MHIGELARLTGASPKAIRHYEALGLLGKVPRRGRYRVYGPRELMRVRLIRQSQQLGFRLADLGIMASVQGPQDWPRLRRGLAAQRQALERELATLEARLELLRRIEADFDDCDVATATPPPPPTVLGACPLVAPAPAATPAATPAAVARTKLPR